MVLLQFIWIGLIGYSTRRRSRSKLARPYIWRLITFNRFNVLPQAHYSKVSPKPYARRLRHPEPTTLTWRDSSPPPEHNRCLAILHMMLFLQSSRSIRKDGSNRAYWQTWSCSLKTSSITRPKTWQWSTRWLRWLTFALSSRTKTILSKQIVFMDRCTYA